MKVIQRHLYLFLLFIGFISTGPTTDISVEKYIKLLSESKTNNTESSEPNIWNLHMKYVPKPRLFQRLKVMEFEYGVITNVLNPALNNTTTIEPPIELLTKMGILKPESEENTVWNSANIQKVFVTCSFKILFCVIFIILL